MRNYGKMHKMQHVEQLAKLRQVGYEKETTSAAAVKRKAPPDVRPSTPVPSIVAYSLTFKNDDKRRFLKSDITLVREKGDIRNVSL